MWWLVLISAHLAFRTMPYAYKPQDEEKEWHAPIVGPLMDATPAIV